MAETPEVKKPAIVLKQGEKIMWVACRVKGRIGPPCDGRQAVMSLPISLGAGGDPRQGSFVPQAGGKIARYRCTTCNGTFVIGS